MHNIINALCIIGPETFHLIPPAIQEHQTRMTLFIELRFLLWIGRGCSVERFLLNIVRCNDVSAPYKVMFTWEAARGVCIYDTSEAAPANIDSSYIVARSEVYHYT